MSELRKLLAEATPGPWWADVGGFGTIFHGASYEDSRGENDWLYDPHHATDADAALIVYLRNHAEDIAALIEAAREESAANDRAQLHPTKENVVAMHNAHLRTVAALAPFGWTNGGQERPADDR